MQRSLLPSWRIPVLLALVWAVTVPGLTAPPKPLPDPDTFLAAVFARIKAWEKNPPRPEYKEHRVTDYYDGDTVDHVLNEIYQITWYRDHAVYVQIEKNGHHRSSAALAKEKKDKEAAIDEQIAHPSGKEHIQAVYLTPLLARYRYHLVRRETLWGRSAIVINFEPIEGKFPEKKISTRILENTAGTIWVDEEQKELMKVVAGIRSPVRVGWGILGSINILTLEYHRQELPNGQWFVKYLEIRVKVRVFLFTKYNQLVKSTVFDIKFPPEK